MAEYIRREVALEIIKRTSGDYAAAFAEVREAPAADVAELVHGRWISVKDRLPEIGERVLTLDKWGHIHDRLLYRFNDAPKTLTFRPDGLMPGRDITHWMPMLELPKEN